MKSYYTFWLAGVSILLLSSMATIEASAQSCFEVNTSNSNIVLSSGSAKLPDIQDTLSIPCTKTIENFELVVDYQAGTETYFEDSTQLSAFLVYNNTTYFFSYDKVKNTFSLPNTQLALGDGTYRLTIGTTACNPFNTPCDDCSYEYIFDVKYNNNSTPFVIITSVPSPAVLTCHDTSSVVLIDTTPHNIGFNAQWSVLINSEYVDIPSATDSFFTATFASTYRYTLSGPGGCSVSNTISVAPPQTPNIFINPDTQILTTCVQKITGVSTTNTGGADNLQYVWTPSNNGILINGDSTESPVVGAPGTYTVMVTRKDNACTATNAVTTVAGNIPVVSAQINPAPDTMRLDCQLTEIILHATANQAPGPSPFLFEWSDGSAGQDLLIKAPGIYSVTATSTTSGCKGAATILITQDITEPAIQIMSLRDTVCTGETITLNALIQEPCSYQWDDNTTNSTNNVMPMASGINQYFITVTALDNSCTQSATKWIQRVDPPTLSCVQDFLTVQNGSQVSFDCSTTGGQIIWLTASTNIRDIPPSGTGHVQNQTFTLTEAQAPGLVSYALYGKNAGCTSARVDVEVQVTPNSESAIYIPELITPNGDGLNDNWDIIVPESINNPESYQLTLFNRYGAQVYEGNLANPFNADAYPNGTYYYALSTPDGSTVRGAVTILRRQ